MFPEYAKLFQIRILVAFLIFLAFLVCSSYSFSQFSCFLEFLNILRFWAQWDVQDGEKLRKYIFRHLIILDEFFLIQVLSRSNSMVLLDVQYQTTGLLGLRSESSSYCRSGDDRFPRISYLEERLR